MSFVVGILHGLAGSGVAVGGLTTAAGVLEDAFLIETFAIASILTMGALAALWGTVLSRTAGRVLQVDAGIAAAVIGCLILGSLIRSAGWLP